VPLRFNSPAVRVEKPSTVCDAAPVEVGAMAWRKLPGVRKADRTCSSVRPHHHVKVMLHTVSG
jgi:hypothetical protein